MKLLMCRKTLWCLLSLLFVAGSSNLLAQGGPSPDAEHKILSGDRLNVTVEEQPDLNTAYGVDGDGTILIKDLGRVAVAGLTLEDASGAIKSYLENKFFKSANVSITLAQFVQGRAFVTGAVGGGGGENSRGAGAAFAFGSGGTFSISFSGDQFVTVFEAIIQAGGLHPRANSSEVMILRWKPGSIQREVRYVDVRAMFENQDFTNDEYLRPRDIVYVPPLGGDESHEVLVLGFGRCSWVPPALQRHDRPQTHCLDWRHWRQPRCFVCSDLADG